MKTLLVLAVLALLLASGGIRARVRVNGKTGRKYLVDVAIGVDQLVNALVGGWPDETISSRWGKKIRDGKALSWLQRHAVDIIERWDPGHFQRAVEYGGAHGPTRKEGEP